MPTVPEMLHLIQGDKREPVALSRPTHHRTFSNIRSEKMLVPRCADNPVTGFQGCQDRPGAVLPEWVKECIGRGHDPYYSMIERKEIRPKYVEVCSGCEKPASEHDTLPAPQETDFADPEQYALALEAYAEGLAALHQFTPSGRHRVVGSEEYIWFEEQANTKQVQVSPRVSGHTFGFDAMTWARAHGYIKPSMHPTKPIKDICAYHNCWAEAKIKTSFGNFCNEEGAKRVILDYRGKSIEAHNQERMQEQLESVRVQGV